MSITYKGYYSLTGEEWTMSFDNTTALGARILIGQDWHELYFVMPGECLEPWMCPLVPTDNADGKYIRFLEDTGLENFYWVPVQKRGNDNTFITNDEAAMRLL